MWVQTEENPFGHYLILWLPLGYKYTQSLPFLDPLNFLSSISKPSNKNSMENLANRIQHHRGLNNGHRNGSTLPKTENSVRSVAKQTRGNTLARWGNDRANNLNVRSVLYKCSIYQKRFQQNIKGAVPEKQCCRAARDLVSTSGGQAWVFLHSLPGGSLVAVNLSLPLLSQSCVC